MSVKSDYYITSFDNLKLNYIVIPKTGSTSIIYNLLKENGNTSPSKNSGWLHSDKNIKYITKAEAIKNGYSNFTYLRDPYDRAKSAFKDFCFNRTSIGGGQGSDEFLHAFNKIRKKKDFYQMFKMVEEFPDELRGVHFRSQCSFCILPNLAFFDIDKDGHFEKLNSTKQVIELTSRDKNLIERIYEKDFELWENNK